MGNMLRDLAEVHYGKSPNGVLSIDSEIPVIGTGGVYGKATDSLFNGPAVVVARKGTLGNPQFVDEPFWAVDTTYAVIPKKYVDAKWLYYSLAAFDLTKLNEATGVPSISREWLYRIRMGSAKYPEQRRIAEILTTVDEAIEQTEALIAKYQQIKAGLMHDLFTRGVTPDGRLRPPRDQAPHLYKESPLGWIPKEWEVKGLRDVAKYQHGRSFPSSEYSGDGVLLLRPGNLHMNGIVTFDESHTTRIPIRWLSLCPEYALKRDDIVMNLTAQSLDDQFLGRVCVVADSEVSLLNQRLARFKTDCLEHYFLYWLLRSWQFRIQIDRTPQGTKVQHIYNSDLDRILLAVPLSRDEQARIAAMLWSATKHLLAEESAVEKFQQQKQGLMHDLLTGRVRVPIRNDEEALAPCP